MAHLTSRSAYSRLVDRLNRFPQGAPASEVLYKILQILFREDEAELVALLPIRPFTAATAARVWKRPVAESRRTLDCLASRGILLDTEQDGESVYTLPPPMAGFFEFSMMRIREDVDQKLLAELFYQYLNVEEDFIKALFTNGETQMGRVFVHEPALSESLSLSVLDFERASEVIATATHMAVGICYCRHKMEHLGRACDAPMDICMTFNSAASSLIKHGIARPVDRREGLDLLRQAYDENLVQFGENVRQGVNFICNCCGCCCEAMLAAKRFGLLHPVHTTNYLPVIEGERCNGCGKCVDVCAVEAMGLISANDPDKPRKKKARLNEDLCLGCGVCVRNCPQDALCLEVREERVITPLNSAHKAVLMAIERGKLQNLIFDNQALWNHRAMAAIVGVILKLPPLKQVLASTQMKSRYLEYMLLHLNT
ncbi:MAG TPA: 4Fe-4S dicluster domain-containing protein [Bacteroidota bacterium]|nr:4Fe-4S dicluster domain-containing protein [Bacteroidota bacterium]